MGSIVITKTKSKLLFLNERDTKRYKNYEFVRRKNYLNTKSLIVFTLGICNQRTSKFECLKFKYIEKQFAKSYE